MQIAQGLQKGQTLFQEAAGKAYGITGTPRPIEQIVGELIQVFITLLGVLFLGLAIYAGYLWMTARGKDENVKKAKDILEQSVIGIIIVLGAYALTAFIISRLTTATGTGGSGALCGPGEMLCPDGKACVAEGAIELCG